ncbi:MAG: hypothetical protein GY820_01065 [Gammaproteobacteria bacterium]|nr:hypothetical protein [Gammaproteobacteria bacterium]
MTGVVGCPRRSRLEMTHDDVDLAAPVRPARLPPGLGRRARDRDPGRGSAEPPD